MKKVALLRGVTPVGQNCIPKMAYLAEILTEAGLENVKTYIQSGNIVFETTLSDGDVCALIHDTIQAKIGADLSSKRKPSLRRLLLKVPLMKATMTHVFTWYLPMTILTKRY